MGGDEAGPKAPRRSFRVISVDGFPGCAGFRFLGGFACGLGRTARSHAVTHERTVAAGLSTGALVGRRQRLGLEHAIARREPQVVLVLGEPGIGKSRLAEEFARPPLSLASAES